MHMKKLKNQEKYTKQKLLSDINDPNKASIWTFSFKGTMKSKRRIAIQSIFWILM